MYRPPIAIASDRRRRFSGVLRTAQHDIDRRTRNEAYHRDCQHALPSWSPARRSRSAHRSRSLGAGGGTALIAGEARGMRPGGASGIGVICRIMVYPAGPACHIRRMAGRDKWNVDLKCPDCGASGTAEVSEDDNLIQPAGTLRVDRLSAGFRLRSFGGTMRTTQFECVSCGVLTQR
jgi:hypothetical protein